MGGGKEGRYIALDSPIQQRIQPLIHLASPPNGLLKPAIQITPQRRLSVNLQRVISLPLPQ